jgi:hypothetical protein
MLKNEAGSVCVGSYFVPTTFVSKSTLYHHKSMYSCDGVWKSSTSTAKESSPNEIDIELESDLEELQDTLKLQCAIQTL